jgi:hypothetical protein
MGRPARTEEKHQQRRCQQQQHDHDRAGHYEPFLGGHERAVEAELSFLRRYLLDPARAEDACPATVDSAPHRGGQR